jgi:periplasmic divalent cation tolerance protein
MYIAWTTVSKVTEAEAVAKEAVEKGLAACVQVEAISSYYTWEGKIEVSSEFRLCFKCTKENLKSLEQLVLGKHPYKTPEWTCVEVTYASEKYLSWVEGNSTA